MSTDDVKRKTGTEGDMVRTVTTTELKRQLGDVLKAVDDGDSVVIEQRGQPKAAVISLAKLDEYERALRLERRQEALDQLKALRKEVGARNQDLTEEQAMELATRFVREVVEEMYDEGKLRYADE